MITPENEVLFSLNKCECPPPGPEYTPPLLGVNCPGFAGGPVLWSPAWDENGQWTREWVYRGGVCDNGSLPQPEVSGVPASAIYTPCSCGGLCVWDGTYEPNGTWTGEWSIVAGGC